MNSKGCLLRAGSSGSGVGVSGGDELTLIRPLLFGFCLAKSI
jgi:hypothetical protein